jgi:hypothetical protein
LLADAFKLAFEDFDEEFDADLFAEAFRVAPSVPAALPLLAEVLDALSVAWLDEPPLLAVVVLDALPELAEEAPPPAEVLVSDELPEVLAELAGGVTITTGLGVGVEAVFLVELEVDVSLLADDLFAEAFSEAPSVPAALELAALFAEEASVVAREALALFDADAVWLCDELLLELDVFDVFFDAVAANVELLDFDRLFVVALLALAVWLYEAFRLLEELLVSE